MNRFAASLLFFLLDDFEYGVRVAVRRRLDDLFGNRPGHNKIRALAEAIRTCQPQLRIKAGQLRQTVGIRHTTSTRLAVLHAYDRVVVDQGLEDFLGRPVVRIVADTQLVYAIPERLAMPECLDSRPVHLEPGRRNPLLAALETLLNKMDLHAGRLLRPEFDDLDFDELVDAAGAVGPPLSHMEFRTLWHVSSFTVLGSVEKCSEPTPKWFFRGKNQVATPAQRLGMSVGTSNLPTVSKSVDSQQFRSQRGRLGAWTSWARTQDRAARTLPARRAFLDRFDKEVDPDGELPIQERAKRAEWARRAYYQRLAMKSAAARQRRKGICQQCGRAKEPDWPVCESCIARIRSEGGSAE